MISVRLQSKILQTTIRTWLSDCFLWKAGSGEGGHWTVRRKALVQPALARPLCSEDALTAWEPQWNGKELRGFTKRTCSHFTNAASHLVRTQLWEVAQDRWTEEPSTLRNLPGQTALERGVITALVKGPAYRARGHAWCFAVNPKTHWRPCPVLPTAREALVGVQLS